MDFREMKKLYWKVVLTRVYHSMHKGAELVSRVPLPRAYHVFCLRSGVIVIFLEPRLILYVFLTFLLLVLNLSVLWVLF